MCNLDIRSELKQRGVFQWEVAAFLGVSEMTLIRHLRKELPDSEKQALRRAILQISEKKESDSNA